MTPSRPHDQDHGAVVGATLMPKPFGVWGLADKELNTLPGYRSAAVDKAEAKRLLASPGHGGSKPLRVELVTRAFAIHVDLAAFVSDQLRLVGIDAPVKQIETAQYFPTLARREFQIGANLTAGAVDDPDVLFYENYKCGSPPHAPRTLGSAPAQPWRSSIAALLDFGDRLPEARRRRALVAR